MRFDVIGIDSPCVDPNKGQRVKALSWQGGGKVATGMVAAARLGAKCAIWGTVGDDLYGNFCVRDFKEHGIDTNYMLKRPGQTTALSVVVSDQQTQGRNILYHPGTADPIREEELPENGKPDTSYFFLSKVDPLTKKVAQAARQAGAKTFIDADSYSEELPNSFSMLSGTFSGRRRYGNKLPLSDGAGTGDGGVYFWGKGLCGSKREWVFFSAGLSGKSSGYGRSRGCVSRGVFSRLALWFVD